jgi:hypothetical protein
MASMPSAMAQHRTAITPRWRGRLMGLMRFSREWRPFDFIHQEMFSIDAAQVADFPLTLKIIGCYIQSRIGNVSNFVWRSPSSLRPAKLPAPWTAPAFLPVEAVVSGITKK